MQFLTLVFWLALGISQQSAGGSIEGTVLRTGTVDPLERVQVTLSPGDPTPINVLTDKEGRFSFPKVAPGRYTISLRRDGYLVPSATVSEVAVRGAEQVKGLTYYLTPGGTISGRILDLLGRPSAAADVVALRLIYQGGQATVIPVKSATSNDRGEYRIYWLEPGEYIVRAEKALPSGPARAYYPAGVRAATAVKVRVSEGAEKPRIDIPLERDETFKISGAVTNIVASVSEAGEAPPVPQFYLSPLDPDEIYDGIVMGTNVLTSAEDRAAGRFEIRNVRPGSYSVIAVLADRKSTPPRYFIGRTPVDVGVQDASDVSLLITPGRDLRGRITPPSALQVQLQPKGILPALPFASSLSATAEADGTFMIPNVPDLTYVASLSPLPKDAYIADLRQGSFSIFDVGTIVIGKRANDDFEVVVDSPGAGINGTVSASNAELAAGVAVVLLPDERRRENLSLYKRTNASTAGVFSFTGVAPGRYRILASGSIPPGAEFNGVFMDGFRDDGKEITVGPGDTTVVELSLIPK